MVARQNILFSLVVIFFVLAVLAAPILPIALGSKTAQADVAGWSKHLIDGSLDGAAGLYLHDIDGDGNPDIVAAGSEAAAIVWYEAPDNPDGPWIRHNIDTNFATGDVYVHDIDGDGNPDVATASYWDGDVVWYEAPDDPTGSWLKHYIDTSLTHARSPVQVHDVDGDGNPDVVATAESGDNVVWYEAPDDPTGTWTRYTIDSNNNGARQLDVYDIDNDSNPDVVVTSYGSDELVWYEAPDDPTQVWVRHVIDNTGDTAGYLHVHDIDMDGNADVVTTIELAGNQLVWYESPDDPTGAWAKHEIDSSLTGAYRVYVGDIDGDGDPDAAVKDDNKVFWYEAPDVPSGAWAKHEIDSNLAGSGDVHVFDINGDGALDVAATGSVADDVVWYENLGAPSTDLYWLSKCIMSEASVGTTEEQVAVGWTVLNRLDSGRFGDDIESVVKSGYAYNQEPTSEITALAKEVIERNINDPTAGATYLFSPRSMPKEGESTEGSDVGGWLHEVPGVPERVYFPSWTSTFTWVGDLHSVRRAYFMFYTELGGPNTSLGPKIPVDLTEAFLTFDTVTGNGTTSVTTSQGNPGGGLPEGFRVRGQFVDITTTATYTGPVTVGISYDPSEPNPQNLKLFHWEGGQWVDVTTSVDTVNNIVYGQVSSFSWFFIGGQWVNVMSVPVFPNIYVGIAAAFAAAMLAFFVRRRLVYQG